MLTFGLMGLTAPYKYIENSSSKLIFGGVGKCCNILNLLHMLGPK